MLKRGRSIICVNNVTRLLVDLCHPISKFFCIRNSCRKEHKSRILWCHYNAFFPYHTSFSIPHVMHFIKNNPSHLTSDL
uniref:Uncharacterized protein MANES_07G030200 n=1 Tax=Rhizophora mucronata TaxID=61149 RepID=A0A2P2JZP1_RHIMU